MPTVNFVGADSSVRTTTAPNGFSVMEAAIRSDIPGIVAECGGACACATCHVHIDTAWTDAVGGPNEMEEQMLEFVPHRAATSRLSCQIRITAALNGLFVHVPATQRS